MNNQGMNFTESDFHEYEAYDFGNISLFQMGASQLPGDSHKLFEESYSVKNIFENNYHLNQNCVEIQDFIKGEEDILFFPKIPQIKNNYEGIENDAYDYRSVDDVSPFLMGASPLLGGGHKSFEESYSEQTIFGNNYHVNKECIGTQNFIKGEEDVVLFPKTTLIKKQIRFQIEKEESNLISTSVTCEGPRKAAFHGRFKRRYLKYLKRIINMSLSHHGKNMKLKKIPKKYVERVSSLCEKPSLKMTVEQFLLDQEFVKWNLNEKNENHELLKELKAIFKHFLKVKLHIIIKHYLLSHDFILDNKEILEEKGKDYLDDYLYHSERYVSYFISSNESNGNRTYTKRKRLGL
jgi:hypothetical protein